LPQERAGIILNTGDWAGGLNFRNGLHFESLKQERQFRAVVSKAVV
jgi:hypothetical protein